MFDKQSLMQGIAISFFAAAIVLSVVAVIEGESLFNPLLYSGGGFALAGLGVFGCSKRRSINQNIQNQEAPPYQQLEEEGSPSLVPQRHLSIPILQEIEGLPTPILSVNPLQR